MVLIGEANVGKTCLLTRYIKNLIPKQPTPTIGVEFATRIVKLPNNVSVKAQLWDTAGQEKYRAMTIAYLLSLSHSHYRKALGGLIVYDVTKRPTYDKVSRWVKELQANAEPQVCLMLVGNKVDLCEESESRREVPREEAERYAAEQGMQFFETSALADTNVKAAFEQLLDSKVVVQCS